VSRSSGSAMGDNGQDFCPSIEGLDNFQDAVLVQPGGRIPVDGQVVGGHSFVDQAPITGESMPVEKQAGSSVYADTINQSGALELRVERLGRETIFGKIIEAVETAEKSRAPIQGIADRLAGYLVYLRRTFWPQVALDLPSRAN